LSRLGSESENSANEMVFMHSGHTEKINDLSYHPSQDLVASVADNGMVQVWQPSRNAIIA
jgi:WD40 repeat protein